MMNAQTPAGKIAANNQLDGSLAKVLVLTENYPQLRSSDQFMRLQDELSGTENRISVARKRYNDAIQDYNTFILAVPQQHLGGNGRIPPEQCLLHGQPGIASRAQREF
jgi:LemA protein